MQRRSVSAELAIDRNLPLLPPLLHFCDERLPSACRHREIGIELIETLKTILREVPHVRKFRQLLFAFLQSLPGSVGALQQQMSAKFMLNPRLPLLELRDFLFRLITLLGEFRVFTTLRL